MRRVLACAFAFLLLHVSAFAGERWTIGLSTSGAAIEAVAIAGRSDSSPTVLLIGGLQGRDESSDAVAREAAAFEATPQRRRPFRLIAIAVANPDAQPLQFPPSGVAYRDHVESHVLWRWTGTHAPDLVLVAGPDPGLTEALSQHAVAEVGQIPARRVDASTRLLQSLPDRIPVSSAHQEIDRRRARSARAFAEQLARVYGRDFTQPNYIAAMAVISRLRLGERKDVALLLAPYLDGAKNSFAKPSQSSLAAHLLFFEYARRTRDDRAAALVRNAAASGFTDSGELREFMPLHGGWSDSLFMDVPILAKAGALTGDRRYFDMAARHVAFMQQIVLRPDGLYRHQASADAAWGRGNAFPALGLALTLSEFPRDHAAYPRLLGTFQAHMQALARFQDENGMWRNVIDRPGAYPEYSATAMIATAMLRGIRQGWNAGRTSPWSTRHGGPSSPVRVRTAASSTSAKAPARAGSPTTATSAAPLSSAATSGAPGWRCFSRQSSQACKPGGRRLVELPLLQDVVAHERTSRTGRVISSKNDGKWLNSSP